MISTYPLFLELILFSSLFCRDGDQEVSASSNDHIDVIKVFRICSSSNADCQNKTKIIELGLYDKNAEIKRKKKEEEEEEEKEKEKEEEEEPEMVVKFVPVFPDKALPYYKSVKVPKTEEDEDVGDYELSDYEYLDEDEDNDDDYEDDAHYVYDDVEDEDEDEYEDLDSYLEHTGTGMIDYQDDYPVGDIEMYDESGDGDVTYHMPVASALRADNPAEREKKQKKKKRVHQRPYYEDPTTTSTLRSSTSVDWPPAPTYRPAVTFRAPKGNSQKRQRPLRGQGGGLRKRPIRPQQQHYHNTLRHGGYNSQRRRKKRPSHHHHQQQYKRKKNPFPMSMLGSYSRHPATFMLPPRRIISSTNRRIDHNRHTEVSTSDLTSGLLALLPLVLLGGLTLGFFLPFTNNAKLDQLNVININGTEITNEAVPMNTIMAENNDMDNIMVNVPKGMHGTWTDYFKELWSDTLDILGTSRITFFPDVVSAARKVHTPDLLGQLRVLSGKMKCVNEGGNSDRACSDRVICEHFSNDYAAYHGNMLIRGGEMFLVTLVRWFEYSGTAEEVSLIMDHAVSNECKDKYRCRDEVLVEKCRNYK